MNNWSNLAKVVYKRTYSRNDNGTPENWNDTVERVIKGNIKNHNVSSQEIDRLRYFMLNRKAIPAGRGLWYSGSPSHDKLGGAALNNCWFVTADDINNFVVAMDLLALGGGVGLSVEHKFVSKLPKIKKGVQVIHKNTKDADFIVPDSRQGWCDLFTRILESFFITGKSFTYSTVCVRGQGEKIVGFGGTASGPQPLIKFTENLCALFISREGRSVRPIDAADILCITGELIVSGNVRRSACIILGDAFDKDYLKIKRWDLGQIPIYRSNANFSIVVDDIEDLHPLFWKSYEHGEALGIVNRKNMQTYGRMGEKKKDTAEGVNPCITGDTLVYVADGRGNIPIKTLSEEDKDVPVFCLNNKGHTEIRTMRSPRITGKNMPVFKISLDDGSFLKATENHKFLLKSGEYREVKDLKIGDSLNILTKYEASLQEIFKNSNSRSQDYIWLANGIRKTKAEHRYIAEFHNNIKIEDGSVVHHKDYNAKNNHPDNLIVMSKKDHDELHSKDMIGDKNPMRRAKTEWSPEKWQEYRAKHSGNSTGEDNCKYSGYTNEQLKEHAKILVTKLQRRFSINEWENYAEPLRLPYTFGNWRKNHLGGIVSLSKWAALESNLPEELIKIIDLDTRIQERYKKYLGEGYNCKIENKELIFLKNCEHCGKEIRTPRKEVGLCSSSCSNKARDQKAYKLASISIKKTCEQRHESFRLEQIKVYKDLQENLKRIPFKKEWQDECKKVGISFEISRKSSPFTSWKELKDDAFNYNHRIVSVEFSGYEDVYNGTVDEFHNFYVGGFESKTSSGKKKWSYINNLQCGEAMLENQEPCNLQELALANISDEAELIEAAKLMHRYGKRVTTENYHHKKTQEVVSRNRRIGTGITGCLASPLFNANTLDNTYKAIQEENVSYSKELGIPESIRTTVVKPSGTVSKLLDQSGEGIHAAYSRYMIQTIRFAADDAVVPLLKAAGHPIEPVIRFDGSYDNKTVVVSFYIKAPDNMPCADEDFDTWKQLDTLMLAQKHWSDQAVSVTVYYKKEEIYKIKEWLTNNLKNIKTISFLCHNDHGFKQAPKQAITKEEYEKQSEKIKDIEFVGDVSSESSLGLDCDSGSCPVK